MKNQSKRMDISEIQDRLEHTVHVLDGYMAQFHEAHNVPSADELDVSTVSNAEFWNIVALYRYRTDALGELARIIQVENSRRALGRQSNATDVSKDIVTELSSSEGRGPWTNPTSTKEREAVTAGTGASHRESDATRKPL